jgi:PIN domain nuclease of toxin-antitoxin system
MNPRKLSKKVKMLIHDTEGYDELLCSAISPWEFSKLLEKKRLGISCNPEDWIKAALDMPKLRVIPRKTGTVRANVAMLGKKGDRQGN